MSELPVRGIPGCCAKCESRTVVSHCPPGVNENCKWVKCKKCGAVTGIVSHWAVGHDSVVFVGFKRQWFYDDRNDGK